MYQRLKLIDLIQPAQDAFLEDRITAGHAILMARLQPKDQHKALEECFQDDWGYKAEAGKGTLSACASSSEWIQENIHLDLHAAPFKKDAEALVPQAGPCTTCPEGPDSFRSSFRILRRRTRARIETALRKAAGPYRYEKSASYQAKGGGEQVLEVTSGDQFQSQGEPRRSSARFEISRDTG